MLVLSSKQSFTTSPRLGPRTRSTRPCVCICSQHRPAQGPATEARRAFLIALALGSGALQISAAATAAAPPSCSDYKTSSSGLQWCDIQEGTGKSPNKGQSVKAHYTGRLASNGAVFDSSYERRRPLNFKVGIRQVIAGWDQGIIGSDDIPPMKEGGKRQLIIPPELGYGQRGAGGVIPPNATLQFDVELLGKK
ncbi:hypothetical protein WJX84_001776 [Apatococcus fuscideae]|uniref:peptidylprolyl isomerase n=1 Tax=Apatococcus fuscideae TaxID=2026836 RepID=A0AAW1TAX2_9CHLO